MHIANEQNPLMQQHFGKFEKLFCSIALILHLAEGSIGPVTATSALRAAAWCEYLSRHARRIGNLVKRYKVTTARMVSRRQPRRWKMVLPCATWCASSGRVSPPPCRSRSHDMAILEENSHVQNLDSINTMGRPTVRYYINPHIKKVGEMITWAEQAKAAIAINGPGWYCQTTKPLIPDFFAVSVGAS